MGDLCKSKACCEWGRARLGGYCHKHFANLSLSDKEVIRARVIREEDAELEALGYKCNRCGTLRRGRFCVKCGLDGRTSWWSWIMKWIR